MVVLARSLSLCLVLLLSVASFAQSVTFTSHLTGLNEKPNPGDPDGVGFSVVTIDPVANTVSYTILAQHIAAPNAAHIHRGLADAPGPVVVNFAPTFTNGFASGTVAASHEILMEILANPAAFYVNVHTADFPAGAVRGQLAPVAAGTTDVVFPIVGSVPGANNTFYRTDLSLLNTSGAATQVVLEYYGTGAAGMASPTSTATLSLASGEQLSLNGGTLQQLLGAADGTGALRVVSTRPIEAVARIYNDQRAVDAGTLSQFVPGLSSEYNRTVGALPMLANQQSANGYRTNIGWFNAGETAATVTFRLHRPDGTSLETSARVVPAGSQQQVPLNQLFPSIEAMDSLYVTFTSAGAPVYVYASVVDNKNGDAIFIPAQPR